jgi:DNA-directed RNA polymerase
MKIIQQLQKQKDAHGLRCDFLLKLGVVKAFENVDHFYYPMSLDFRGRVYPIAPHFNHIGADLSRGLLKFGESKKLGKSGLKWLKIHCANLMGQDKKPVADKLIFL